MSAYDIATFGIESLSSRLNVLTPDQVENIIRNKMNLEKLWIIDFFSPVSAAWYQSWWDCNLILLPSLYQLCPPCMNFLPEFRKASKNLEHVANFGTIDCTIHQQFCSKVGSNFIFVYFFYHFIIFFCLHWYLVQHSLLPNSHLLQSNGSLPISRSSPCFWTSGVCLCKL